MPNVTRIAPPTYVPPGARDLDLVKSLQTKLVALNKQGKTGMRTVTFRAGRKPMNTQNALRALQAFKTVRVRVVEFKTVALGKPAARTNVTTKLPVRGIKVQEFTSVKALEAFVNANVFAPNKAAARGV